VRACGIKILESEIHNPKSLMICYYITDRRQFAGDAREQWRRLLAKIAEAARAGIDYIQLRERDLMPQELEILAQEAVETIRQVYAGDAANHLSNASPKKRRTRLLINSRVDIALAAGADGVHLRSGDLAASEARVIWDRAATKGKPGMAKEPFLVAVSCHTLAELRSAESHGADFSVFAPVFEKVTFPQAQGIGLQALRKACSQGFRPANLEGVGAGHMPVLALGGVTMDNAAACLEAGAAGIAAIRLFQDHDVAETLSELRELRVR